MPSLCQVVLDMMYELQASRHIGIMSEFSSPALFEYATSSVKDKLLEARNDKTHPRFLDSQIDYVLEGVESGWQAGWSYDTKISKRDFIRRYASSS